MNQVAGNVGNTKREILVLVILHEGGRKVEFASFSFGFDGMCIIFYSTLVEEYEL